MTSTLDKSVRRGITVELASILWMLVEAAVAISAGITARSLALFAFGLDSVVEIFAGIVLLWRLWIELRGRDTTQIKRAEKKASWLVGAALLLLAVYIVVLALYNLVGHRSADASTLGISLAIAAGIIMPYLARTKIKIGAEIGSAALKADGYCSWVCAYMSWLLVVGVISTALVGWWWIDSALSLMFVYFIIREGIEAIQSARGLECDCCGVEAE